MVQEAFLEALTEFVCRGLRGTLPNECAQGLLAANLIPFRKPRDPQGVRPIAVGETLRRLTAKVALAQALPKSRGLLPPLQCGVGVHDSVNSIVVATMRATQLMEQNPSLRLIQVDMKNAFNSLRRENILEYVSNFLPSLLPWAAWSLCNPSTLFWEQHSLPSTTGVQQGDPLGPLLFSCGIQPIVESIKNEFPETTSWWYLDDGNILAPADQVPRIFERLSVLFTRAGLTINAGKCQIFGMAGESVNLMLNGICVPEHSGASSDDGVVLLGVPIGGVEFIKDRLTELVASAREYCKKLLELQDAQVALTLLRLCGGTCRIVHLMRAVSPLLIAQQLAEFDQLVMETFTQCTGVHLDLNSSRQVALPVSMGGVGLTRAQDISGAAWLEHNLLVYPRVHQLSWSQNQY